jgi:hypothetical protein
MVRAARERRKGIQLKLGDFVFEMGYSEKFRPARVGACVRDGTEPGIKYHHAAEREKERERVREREIERVSE